MCQLMKAIVYECPSAEVIEVTMEGFVCQSTTSKGRRDYEEVDDNPFATE